MFAAIMTLSILAAPAEPAGPSAVSPAGPAAVPAFADICLQGISDEGLFPSVNSIKQRLAEVKGHEGRFESARYHERALCQAKGVFRLTEPWRQDTALRIALASYRWYRLYLWRGHEGVALLHHHQWNGTAAWTAYAVRRSGQRPTPDEWSLVATDENRNQQIGPGVLMLVPHDGQMTLVRGDVWLLSVPMKELPSEVYLDIDARILGLEFVACRGGPAAPTHDPIVARLDKPAAVEWTTKLGDNVGFHKLPDGAVELRTKGKTQGGTAMASIGPTGPQAFCFEVEDPQQGTGVLLADREGKEICRLAFCRDQNKPELVMNLREPGSNDANVWVDLNSYPVPYAGKRQWAQVTVGWGVCKMAVSPDGQQWTEYFQKVDGQRPPAARVGLYCIPWDGDRSIRLRSVHSRQIEHLPPQAAGGLGETLRGVIAGADEPAAKLQAIHAVAKMVNTHDASVASELLGAYNELARELAGDGHERPFSLLTAAVLRLPCAQRIFHQVNSADPLVAEAVPLMYEHRWPEVRELAQRVRLWQWQRRYDDSLPEQERALAEASDWIAAMLPRQLALPRVERTQGVPYRHLWMPQPSKEAFNAISELSAAVQGHAYREACQTIINQGSPGLGLTPDPKDPLLYTAYPVAVRRMIERVAPLKETMEKEFSRLGRLRLQAALANGDREGMEGVALQFVGTEAAAEASRWLGDRAVSSGQFAQALGHYRYALRDAPAEQKADLSARIRLAAALSGDDVGTPVTAPVQLGSVVMPADRFEQMVAEFRQARAGDRTARQAAACPPPGKYRGERLRAFDFGASHKPEYMPSYGFDWGARQTGAAANGRHLLLCNRTSIVAWGVDGKEAWRQAVAYSSDKHRWTLVPARPAAAGSRVFLRRAMREAPDVVCLDAANGNLLWSAATEDAAASDPLPSGQAVFVFTLRKAFPQKLILSLCRLDADSGDVLQLGPVAEFLDVFDGELPCQATLIDDRLTATVGGAALSCDLAGTVQWTRQQVWMPPRDGSSRDRPWYAACHEPPLAAGQRVICFQPGMKSVECLDLLSGELVWQQTVARIDRVVGLAGERLIVRAGQELLAIELAGGRLVWRHAMPDRLEAQLCGLPGGVLYVKHGEYKDVDAPRRPVLVWLDVQTGRVVGEAMVEGIEQKKPHFGPLVAHENRLWLLVASAEKPQNRTVWELNRQ